MINRFSLYVLLCLVVITGAGYAAYSNSFGVPFYLDDIGSITANPNFKDASYKSLFDAYGMRTVGYVSLWWDYEAHKLNPTNYHATNLIIHLVNGALIFALAFLLLIRTCCQQQSRRALLLATGAALLFVVHPLNSQAVTYIVQRLASLAALFYLLSLVTYIAARFCQTKWLAALLFGASAIAAVLAFFTKQNALTLPLVILAFEYTIMRSYKLRSLAGISAIFIAGIAGLAWLLPDSVGHTINTLDRMSRETTVFSRWDYFTTQLVVIWMYLAKFFTPSALYLDYGLAIDSFTSQQKLIAGLAHIVVIFAAWFYRKRLPLAAFGVFFFYGAHLIESGVVPITDIAFEHRAYLPNVGLILLLAGLVAQLIKNLDESADTIALSAFVGAICLALGVSTYSRNEQWADPLEFYVNEYQSNPNNVRTIHNYAEQLGKRGQLDEAERMIVQMYDVAGAKIDGRMVNTHIALLISQKKYRDAALMGKRLIQQETLDPYTRVLTLSNLGIIYTTLSRYKEGVYYFHQAEEIGNMPIKSLIAYAFAVTKIGSPLKAISIAQELERIAPGHPRVKQIIDFARENMAKQGQTQAPTPPTNP